jgi:hypothetical protein
MALGIHRRLQYRGLYSVVDLKIYVISSARASKPDAPPVSSGTPQTARKKKVSAIRMLSGRGTRDLQIQNSLRGCLNAATKMMKPLISEKKVRLFLLIV